MTNETLVEVLIDLQIRATFLAVEWAECLYGCIRDCRPATCRRVGSTMTAILTSRKPERVKHGYSWKLASCGVYTAFVWQWRLEILPKI